jgi:quercetin dioxygenase-like cupin family protein
MDDFSEQPHYFIDPEHARKFTQTEGLETTVLTGLHGERMMMALNATLPGHSVPVHFHPHEQIGMVLRGRAILRIGATSERLGRATSTAFPVACSTAIRASATNPL